MRLKDMIVHRFKGVSTKYLNNYLVYNNYVNFAKKNLDKKAVILFDFIRKTLHTSKIDNIANRPAIPV